MYSSDGSNSDMLVVDYREPTKNLLGRNHAACVLLLAVSQCSHWLSLMHTVTHFSPIWFLCQKSCPCKYSTFLTTLTKEKSVSGCCCSCFLILNCGVDPTCYIIIIWPMDYRYVVFLLLLQYHIFFYTSTYCVIRWCFVTFLCTATPISNRFFSKFSHVLFFVHY